MLFEMYVCNWFYSSISISLYSIPKHSINVVKTGPSPSGPPFLLVPPVQGGIIAEAVRQVSRDFKGDWI
jgi:hypothetical protein